MLKRHFLPMQQDWPHWTPTQYFKVLGTKLRQFQILVVLACVTNVWTSNQAKGSFFQFIYWMRKMTFAKIISGRNKQSGNKSKQVFICLHWHFRALDFNNSKLIFTNMCNWAVINMQMTNVKSNLIMLNKISF